jgi:hypothetical protein
VKDKLLKSLYEANVAIEYHAELLEKLNNAKNTFEIERGRAYLEGKIEGKNTDARKFNEQRLFASTLANIQNIEDEVLRAKTCVATTQNALSVYKILARYNDSENS